MTQGTAEQTRIETQRTGEQKARDRQIAMTILEQLGGEGRLRTFTGARDFRAIQSGVLFSIPGKNFSKNSINRVRIVLNPSDTYVMEFLRVRGGTIKTVATVDGVFCDMLMDVFEKGTGLFLTFNRRGA